LLVLVLALMLDRARTNAMRQPIVVLLLFLLLVLVPVPVLHAGSGPIATDPTRNTAKLFPPDSARSHKIVTGARGA
jgi:hypothetical protein